MKHCLGVGPGVDTELAGVPIRVELGFLAGAILIGWSLGDVGRVGTFVVLAFISVLVHELGHVVAFRRAGVDARVVLHINGGVTIPYDEVPDRRQRLVIYLAGSATALLTLGLPAALGLALWPSPPVEWEILLTYLVWLNVYYSIVNLLPVLPQDGGKMALEVLQVTVGLRRAPAVAHLLSAATGVVFAVVLLDVVGVDRLGLILALNGLWLAGLNVIALTKLADHTVPKLVEDGYKSLCDGDVEGAATRARDAVAAKASDTVRAYGVQLLIWVELTRGNGPTAAAVLARAPRAVRQNGHMQCVFAGGWPGQRIDASVRGFLQLDSLLPAPVYVDLLARDQLLSEVAEGLLASTARNALEARARFFHLLFRAGWYDHATAFGARLLDTDRLPGRVAFNLACCRAKVGDIDGGVGWLEHSYRALGYRRVDQLVSDDDLAPLRTDPRYQRLCRELGATTQAPAIAAAGAAA